MHCGKSVGKVIVQREGLYVRFSGQLLLPKDHIYRLCAKFEDVTIDLGVLIASGNHFCINTKIQAKKIGKGEPVFIIVLPDNKPMRFIEIHHQKRFEHISLLPDAVFCCDRDKVGILVSND